MARTESREEGKVMGSEEGQHLFVSGGVADECGLRSDDDQACGLAAYADKAHIVGEDAIGEQQPVQILARQRMCQRGLTIGGDDGEAITPCVGGFVINVVTTTNAMFLTAFGEIRECPLSVQPAIVFARPDFEVAFLAALKNSSLARRCCSSC